MRKISTRDLFDIQTATKLQIDGLENHCDLIITNILMGTIYASQLLPMLGLQALNEGKVSPKKVLEICANILEHTMLLCNACNYEIPDEQELMEFEETVPIEVKNDAVMTTMGMIQCFTDIAQIIALDLDQPIWAETEVPEDFETDIFTIVIGIKHLGEKFSFTMDDVIEKLM